MSTCSPIWLAADYHLPLPYTCRTPLTSPYSAKALPGPSPATVRLALIRNSIELFGTDFTKEYIFPVLRSTSIKVRPPSRVAISSTLLRFYKATDNGRLIESIGYREFANAEGLLTVYLQIPTMLQDEFAAILFAVGYWGQTNSFAYCCRVYPEEPDLGACALRLDQLDPSRRVDNYFIAFATEFRDDTVTWEEVVVSTAVTKCTAIQPTIYVWPLLPCKHLGLGEVYARCSLLQSGET